MIKKQIKRIIAREGLIILGLSALLCFLLLFLQTVPVALPTYRLEFANGAKHSISIYPDIRNDSNYKKLLEETYNPSPKLIDKRIKEFIRAGNSTSALQSATPINSGQIYISRLYSKLLGVLFIYKLAIVYFVLLLARFIIWALKTLLER